MDFTFDGRVAWDIKPRTLGSYTRRDALAEQIKAALALPNGAHTKEIEANVFTLAYLLASTAGVAFAFNGKERGGLKDFKRWWELWKSKSADLKQLYMGFVELAEGVIIAWREAFEDAQMLYDPDPAQVPDSHLTPEQREALKDPAAPLAEVGAPTARSS